MVKRLAVIFFLFLLYCSALAFVDIDWNAKDEHSARRSVAMQLMYMNTEQMRTYFDDLHVIEAAGLMGGAKGRLLHGKEVHQIHDLANQIRVKHGVSQVSFPSKSIAESVITFFVVPFTIFMR